MNREARNTVIMILVVFIVSVIALIAVLSISWRFVGGFIIETIGGFSRFIDLQNLNYNFEIPKI